MKKAIAFLLLCTTFACFLCSCTGTTPEKAKEATKLTMETLDWTLQVEGGSAETYTLADAQKHDLSKGVCSMWVGQDGNNTPGKSAIMTSFIIEGITFADFLTDMGKPDATKVTFIGKDYLGQPVEYTLAPEELANPKVIIGWIRNKKEVLCDTETYVGVFDGDGSYVDFPNCSSVEKIVIG